MNAIEFDHVSKQYRLGLVSTKTLSHDIRRFWITNILGKEDPYLKIGETNDRASKGSSEYVWALRDINFNVEQGDVVGIIGKNGAGKSTLLKLLSRVTGPTTGQIRAHGRIGSLLEVGTGFHAEMTGRENIFMNGAILGMTRSEIQSKLDEIVDFSGCERYIDTPVKRYSSGMMVRLGFAVAAHLDPEILVVDEVLAVGDAEFQKKAIGKMQQVSQGEGRTVLFVSHNMASVRQLCKHAVLLKNGMVESYGEVNEIVDFYLKENRGEDFTPRIIVQNKYRDGALPKDLEFVECAIENKDNLHMATDEPLLLSMRIKVNNKNIKEFTVGVSINDKHEIRVGSYVSDKIQVPKGKDEFTIKLTISNHNLNRGIYSICYNIGLKDLVYGIKDYDVIHFVNYFEVVYVTGTQVVVVWNNSWGNCNFRDAKLSIE